MGLEFEADSVQLDQRVYFTAARCRAAIAEDRAEASWLPAGDADDGGDPADLAATGSQLSLGGC